jgi:putative alpha-1,2-mannosidase
MTRFYGMGREKLAFAGMDDAGEMSSWYVLNAIGLYTYSPADPEYIVTVPIFDNVAFDLNGTTFTISKRGDGRKIKRLVYGDKKLKGYFITHSQLQQGKKLVIQTK